jgi:GGDEF domain-containing protein
MKAALKSSSAPGFVPTVKAIEGIPNQQSQHPRIHHQHHFVALVSLVHFKQVNDSSF